MVQSLFLIALASCYQQASSITDIGSTPYHIIRPVLKRINAKQLSLLEENSPEITPASDEIWASLIEKDFSDRPLGGRPNVLLTSGEMPNRERYLQYCQDRERFLEGSADRLRRLTEKFQREKTRNSIVPIKGIIAEPIVRRRTFTGPRPVRPALKYSSNSIMGKARRDVQHRLLMFGKQPVRDPYAAFQTLQTATQKPPSPNRVSQQKTLQRPPPILTQSSSVQKSVSQTNILPSQTNPLRPGQTNPLRSGQGIYLIPISPPKVSAPTKIIRSTSCDSYKPVGEIGESTETLESTAKREMRKRKPQSPLLDSRRKQIKPRRYGSPPSRPIGSKNDGVDRQNKDGSLADSPKRPKAIRSSIFS